MTRTNQKVRERMYLDRFAAGFPSFPPGPVVQQEKPDFLVGSSLRIGVEVTEVLRVPAPGEPPMREQESLRQRVADLAEQEYARNQMPAVHVEIFFGRLASKDVRQLALSVARIVRENVPSAGSGWTGKFSSCSGVVWPTQVLALLVHRPPTGFEDSLWMGSGPAEHVASCTPAIVQRICDDKAASVANYARVGIHQMWLLMVMNDFDHSGVFAVPAECLTAIYRSSFERAFLLRTFDGVVDELQLA